MLIWKINVKPKFKNKLIINGLLIKKLFCNLNPWGEYLKLKYTSLIKKLFCNPFFLKQNGAFLLVLKKKKKEKQ